MPEKDISILTYLASLGAAAIAGVQIFILRQNSALRKDMVGEKICNERRETYQKNLEDKVDSVKADTEKQWDALQEIRDITIETRTLLKERGKRQ